MPIPGTANVTQPTPGPVNGQGMSASPTMASPQAIAATNQITLSITSPANNATVTTATVTVRGKTVPNADVFVNDAQTKSDASGNFSASVTLDEGANPIVVVANDANGNSAEQDFQITYNAG